MKHKIKFDAAGGFKAIYSDEIADVVRDVGPVKITRASMVEPDENGQWVADMSPREGPKSQPFITRQEALDWEVKWIWEQL